jgi:hypothetical protein
LSHSDEGTGRPEKNVSLIKGVREMSGLYETIAVLVDGKLYAWKGSSYFSGQKIPTEARWPRGLDGRYYPTPLPTFQVEIKIAVFEAGEQHEDIDAGVGNWYRQWENHPKARGAYPDYEPSERVVLPLREATFKMVVDRTPPDPERPVLFYWIPEGNIQKKPWDVVNEA